MPFGVYHVKLYRALSRTRTHTDAALLVNNCKTRSMHAKGRQQTVQRTQVKLERDVEKVALGYLEASSLPHGAYRSPV